MISIEEAAANVDRRVVYSRPYCDVEEGTITGASSSTVFVLYDGDLHAKGTNPEDLTFAPEPDPEPIVVDVAPQVVDLVAALRATVEAAKTRRERRAAE